MLVSAIKMKGVFFMSTIADLMGQIAEKEGHNNTNIPGVRIYKASEYRPRHPLCYGKGIIIVGQGNKRVFLGDKVYEYNSDNYLVLSVPLPAECETEATEYEPLLSLMVDIDMGMLNRIVEQMGNDINASLWGQKDKYPGLFVAHTNQDIKDTVVRLLRSLLNPVESKVIGPGIIHELIFRIMNGENAAPLYALTMIHTNLSRIDKALKHIHEEYRHPIDIDKLSNLVNMSPSAFFRAFKEVTSSSPIQYLKKVRLNIAMGLLMANQVRVNEAATEVGYESTTQFSREFKRYFGNSPVSFIPAGKIKLPLKFPLFKV